MLETSGVAIATVRTHTPPTRSIAFIREAGLPSILTTDETTAPNAADHQPRDKLDFERCVIASITAISAHTTTAVTHSRTHVVAAKTTGASTAASPNEDPVFCALLDSGARKVARTTGGVITPLGLLGGAIHAHDAATRVLRPRTDDLVVDPLICCCTSPTDQGASAGPVTRAPVLVGLVITTSKIVVPTLGFSIQNEE